MRKVPYLLLGDHGDRLLIHAGRFDQVKRAGIHVFALHQPIEEVVKTAALGVDMALGQLLGRNVFAFTEPPGPVLEVGEVFLYVEDSDVAHARPVMFLGIRGSHVDRRFEAGEVSFGVPVGGLQGAEKPFAGIAKTEVKILLDDHSSGGT